MSPLASRKCHPDGDTGGEQTLSFNSLNNNSPFSTQQKDRISSIGGREKKVQPMAYELDRIARPFDHSSVCSPTVVAEAAAERRWNTDLNEIYKHWPEDYGIILDALDEALHRQATGAEMKKRGCGISLIYCDGSTAGKPGLTGRGCLI